MKMRLLPSSYWATPSIWSQHLRVTHSMLQELQTVLWTDYHFSFLWRPHPCQGVICPSLLLAHSSDDLWEAHNGAGWWGGGMATRAAHQVESTDRNEQGSELRQGTDLEVFPALHESDMHFRTPRDPTPRGARLSPQSHTASSTTVLRPPTK